MTNLSLTYIPEALNNGLSLFTGSKVVKIFRRNGLYTLKIIKNKKILNLYCEKLYISAGPIHQYALIKEYSLREVLINPEHIVLLRPNHQFTNVDKNKLPKGLHSSQEYTTLYINRGHSGMEITVIGDIDTIEEKLNNLKKRVLKG